MACDDLSVWCYISFWHILLIIVRLLLQFCNVAQKLSSLNNSVFHLLHEEPQMCMNMFFLNSHWKRVVSRVKNILTPTLDKIVWQIINMPVIPFCHWWAECTWHLCAPISRNCIRHCHPSCAFVQACCFEDIRLYDAIHLEGDFVKATCVLFHCNDNVHC